MRNERRDALNGDLAGGDTARKYIAKGNETARRVFNNAGWLLKQVPVESTTAGFFAGFFTFHICSASPVRGMGFCFFIAVVRSCP
jgi:hypothetical protein